MSPQAIVLLLYKSHKALPTSSSMLIFLISGERETDIRSSLNLSSFFTLSSLYPKFLLFWSSNLVLMRAEDNNTLDLNNFPHDPSRDFFPFFEEGSSSSSSSSSGGFREKQGQDGKEYECRFCSLKFFKSQALGGHMNRHRQERETESLNKARELVLRNDSFPPHQGPAPSFSYHQGDVHIGDLISPFKPMMYPPRLFSISTSSSAILSPPPPPQPPLVQPYLYPPSPSPFPHNHTNDYYLGNNNGPRHQTLTNSVCSGRAPPDSIYTFMGAPVVNGSRVAPPRPLPSHHGM